MTTDARRIGRGLSVLVAVPVAHAIVSFAGVAEDKGLPVMVFGVAWAILWLVALGFLWRSAGEAGVRIPLVMTLAPLLVQAGIYFFFFRGAFTMGASIVYFVTAIAVHFIVRRVGGRVAPGLVVFACSLSAVSALLFGLYLETANDTKQLLLKRTSQLAPTSLLLDLVMMAVAVSAVRAVKPGAQEPPPPDEPTPAALVGIRLYAWTVAARALLGVGMCVAVPFTRELDAAGKNISWLEGGLALLGLYGIVRFARATSGTSSKLAWASVAASLAGTGAALYAARAMPQAPRHLTHWEVSEVAEQVTQAFRALAAGVLLGVLGALLLLVALQRLPRYFELRAAARSYWLWAIVLLVVAALAVPVVLTPLGLMSVSYSVERTLRPMQPMAIASFAAAGIGYLLALRTALR